MYEGSSQEQQPQIKFFMKNLFMKLGYPGKNHLPRNGFFTRNPKWLLKGSSRRTLKAIQMVLREELLKWFFREALRVP